MFFLLNGLFSCFFFLITGYIPQENKKTPQQPPLRMQGSHKKERGRLLLQTKAFLVKWAQSTLGGWGGSSFFSRVFPLQFLVWDF